MSKRFFPFLLTFLFIANFQAQEKLIYETGEILSETAIGFIESNNYDKAIQTFKKINPNDSLYPSSLVTISYYQIAQKKFDEALETIEKGFPVGNPEIRHAYFLNKGIAYEGLENYEQAKANYLEGLKEYPRSYKLRYNLAVINKKRDERAELLDNLMLTIEANPFFEKTMLQFGNMYREQNKQAQALLLYNLYLLFSPDGKDSFNVLRMANAMVSTPSKTDNVDYEITVDDDLFESQNLIVESQLALRNDFDIPNELNIPFTRQTYALLNQLKEEPFDGESKLWAQKIIPFFEWIVANKHFDNLAYTTAYSIEKEEFKKVVSRKTDEVAAFLPIAFAKWRELVSVDIQNTKGKRSNLSRNYVDGILAGQGQVDSRNEPSGEWLYYNTIGKLIAKRNFKNGKRNGKWERYHGNGALKEKGQYVNGLEEGRYEFFYDNGSQEIILNFKNAELDGNYELYSQYGAITEQRTYQNGIQNGPRRLFYNGDMKQLRYDYSLENNLIDGPLKEYYPSGQMAKEITLVKGKIEGKETIYHFNGQIASIASYRNDVFEGQFVTYYPSGEKKSTGSYISGEPDGLWKYYHSNGALQEELSYSNGKRNGPYLTYDREGNLLSDFNYRNGLIKEFTYFDKEGNVIDSQKKKGGDLAFKGYDKYLTVTIQGIYDVKDGKKGKWSYYDMYGNLKENGTFKDNKIEGIYTLYHPNGAVKDESVYKDDKLEGYEVVYYPFGQTLSQSYYKEGLREGTMYFYYPNGLLKAENYFHRGEFNGTQKYYAPNGKIANIAIYEFGVLKSQVNYDDTGNVLEEINRFLPENGQLKFTYGNGKLKSISDAKYSLYHGAHKSYDFYGNLEVEGMYLDDKLEGTLKTYHPSGKLKSLRNYLNGELDGAYIQYYENGKIEDTTYYTNGLPKGISEFFNEKGVKTGDLYYEDGNFHGARKFYGEESGALQLIRYYDYGKLIGYSYLDVSGREVPMIELPNGTGKVISYFQNGNIGRQMTYKNGLNQGEYTAYYENGQLERKHNYLDDEYHGKGFKYFPDGSIKIENNHTHGFKQGSERHYHANGKIKEERNYVNDELSGDLHYYNTQGQKIKTEKYFNGDIIKSQSY